MRAFIQHLSKNILRKKMPGVIMDIMKVLDASGGGQRGKMSYRAKIRVPLTLTHTCEEAVPFFREALKARFVGQKQYV